MSANPAVRAALLEFQRRQALKDNIIMEGRDIGTVVLPDAQVKIFLTADPEVRAERRVKQEKEMGIDADFQETLAEMRKRDYQDTHREIAPLTQADDAALVDCTNTGIEETTKIMLQVIKGAIDL